MRSIKIFGRWVEVTEGNSLCMAFKQIKGSIHLYVNTKLEICSSVSGLRHCHGRAGVWAPGGAGSRWRKGGRGHTGKSGRQAWKTTRDPPPRQCDGSSMLSYVPSVSESGDLRPRKKSHKSVRSLGANMESKLNTMTLSKRPRLTSQGRHLGVTRPWYDVTPRHLLPETHGPGLTGAEQTDRPSARRLTSTAQS